MPPVVTELNKQKIICLRIIAISFHYFRFNFSKLNIRREEYSALELIRQSLVK